MKKEKESLRKRIAELKKGNDSQRAFLASRAIFDMVEGLPDFQSAKVVLAYWSMPDEVNTHFFVEKWYKAKTILLPLVVNDQLELRLYTGLECLEPRSPFGILEPVDSASFSIDAVDLAIVPGVGFDSSRNRLGRGKGYYDRLLAGCDVYKVGICYTLQMVERVPTDPFDVKMDVIIHY